ncbi:Protein FAM204A like [Actinidia chinensis var. chinensis]|uniref:Protein FAM204A like n=1 Tax=Actinidia chinensis var. chinensis TaxID=1590841 RepID=A0A2R6RKP9_ACTCC|nr:Protein FAM204A like [Actinidia chinensis var. chinensis]
MQDEDERREAAIASSPSLQPNYKPSGVTQNQLAKFQELHRRRLQVKARSKMKNKVKGMSKKIGESCVKNRDANDFTEGNSSKETDDSDVSILKGKTVKATFSVENENVTVDVGVKKRQKLHWGLDTKERWERKANM